MKLCRSVICDVSYVCELLALVKTKVITSFQLLSLIQRADTQRPTFSSGTSLFKGYFIGLCSFLQTFQSVIRAPDRPDIQNIELSGTPNMKVFLPQGIIRSSI